MKILELTVAVTREKIYIPKSLDFAWTTNPKARTTVLLIPGAANPISVLEDALTIKNLKEANSEPTNQIPNDPSQDRKDGQEQ